MSIMSFEIGTTYAGRVNVETLTTLPNMAPKSKLYTYAEAVEMASGVSVGRGAPYAVWAWEGFIPADLFTNLRALCPGASAAVNIHTLQADFTTYAYYTGIMTWPALDSYEQLAKRHLSFVINFNRLAVYTP